MGKEGSVIPVGIEEVFTVGSGVLTVSRLSGGGNEAEVEENKGGGAKAGGWKVRGWFANWSHRR